MAWAGNRGAGLDVSGEMTDPIPLDCRATPGPPCPAFAHHLSDLIDGACSPDLALWLSRHAALCAACGQALDLARALRSTLRAWGEAAPPRLAARRGAATGAPPLTVRCGLH
jgi:hypothetical protein